MNYTQVLMRWAEMRHMDVLCLSPPAECLLQWETPAQEGAEVAAKSRSKGHTLQCTAHGKCSNNPGVKTELWLLPQHKLWTVTHGGQPILLHLWGGWNYLKWVLSCPMVRSPWPSVDKQKRQREIWNTEKQLEIFNFFPAQTFFFFHTFPISEILDNPIMSQYGLCCHCSGLCLFWITLCHQHQLPNAPVLVVIFKLHFPAEQPTLAIECHCFSSWKTVSSASTPYLSFFSIAAFLPEFFACFASACAKLTHSTENKTLFYLLCKMSTHMDGDV